MSEPTRFITQNFKAAGLIVDTIDGDHGAYTVTFVPIAFQQTERATLAMLSAAARALGMDFTLPPMGKPLDCIKVTLP